ncbi:hypothetical protein BT96DRAFT_755539, partial [Gymnopus androsaceus JB14]
AVWTDADIHAFLDYLVANKARAGDGGNFPGAVYTEAAIEVNKALTEGAEKRVDSCKNKHTKYLHPTFKICNTIDHASGIGGFDTALGGHVTPKTEMMWLDLVSKHPKCEPYKNKGWAIWPKMKEILGSPPPQGLQVY